MRARIASVFVCGFIFLTGTACRQQQAETVPVTPEAPEVVSKSGKKKGTVKKSEKKAASVSFETVAVPDSAAVAAATAAANSIAPKKPGLRVSRVQVPGMYVALTFDDGPSSAYTSKVLDILNRHGAKGTFFVLGSNAKRCSSIVSRAAAEGHEIGVHTWTHINMARSSMAKIDSEVSRTAEVIRSITGKSPAVMRPPYGATNVRIVNHMYDRYGMRSILWDVDTQDWRKPGVSTVVRRAVNKAKPGSIILVHDIHGSTLAAIEGIVTGLQARGFKLVTVSQLMAKAGAYAAPKIPTELPGAAEVTVPVAPETEQPAAESSAVDTPATDATVPKPEQPAAAPEAQTPVPASEFQQQLPQNESAEELLAPAA